MFDQLFSGGNSLNDWLMNFGGNESMGIMPGEWEARGIPPDFQSQYGNIMTPGVNPGAPDPYGVQPEQPIPLPPAFGEPDIAPYAPPTREPMTPEVAVNNGMAAPQRKPFMGAKLPQRKKSPTQFAPAAPMMRGQQSQYSPFYSGRQVGARRGLI